MSGKTVWLIMMDNCLPENGPHNRNYWFARYLKKLGYNPVVFAASRERGNAIQMIAGQAPFLIDDKHGFPFIYIRIQDYGESMKKRIMAIFEFHRRLNKHSDDFVNLYGKPDVIIGTNGYPLSPLLANKLAKKYKSAYICEVCDLWPLSLEEYGIIKTDGLISKAMYILERKNYENADAIIFSMEGGAQYIQDKKWDKDNGGNIDLSKISHINNGVDLDSFFANGQEHECPIPELNLQDNKKNIVYTGSIRAVNNIGFLVNVAQLMQNDNVRFVIVGGGDQLEEVIKEADNARLDNIIFTGPVEKKYIPSILSKADLLLLYSSSDITLNKYGTSQNKMFDYLASGKPVLGNLPSKYSVINNYDCGVEDTLDDPQKYACMVRYMLQDSNRQERWGRNAILTAEGYSFEKHGDRLSSVIERAIGERNEQTKRVG